MRRVRSSADWVKHVALGALLASGLLLSACSTSPAGQQTDTTPTSAQQRDQEYARALIACLQDKGWPADVDPSDGGVIVGGIPNEQYPQYQADQAECEAPLIGDMPQLSDLSEEQWAQLYELEAKTADCLRGEGIDIPSIPSLQAFIDQYKGTEPWTSYGFVGDVGKAKWDELNRVCPQPYI